MLFETKCQRSSPHDVSCNNELVGLLITVVICSERTSTYITSRFYSLASRSCVGQRMQFVYENSNADSIHQTFISPNSYDDSRGLPTDDIESDCCEGRETRHQPIMSDGLKVLPSNDLLSKVLQQNTRLKKTLREVLAHRGLTSSSYLVSRIFDFGKMTLQSASC